MMWVNFMFGDPQVYEIKKLLTQKLNCNREFVVDIDTEEDIKIVKKLKHFN